MKNINLGAIFWFLSILCIVEIERLLFLKFLKKFAFFDSFFWPFNKTHETIIAIFVISAIMASIWNDFIKFRWHDEKLTLVTIMGGNNFWKKILTLLSVNDVVAGDPRDTQEPTAAGFRHKKQLFLVYPALNWCYIQLIVFINGNKSWRVPGRFSVGLQQLHHW